MTFESLPNLNGQHAVITGANGGIGRAIALALARRGAQVTGVTWRNLSELEEFINIWSEKVDFIAVQNFIPPELAHDYSQFIPTNSEYVQDILSGFNCQQPWQRVYVRNNGEVCPCCTFFNEELSLGNIAEHSIHELWKSDKMRFLRNIHKEGKYELNPWCLSCVKGTCGIMDDSEFVKIRNSYSNKK